MAVAHDIAKVLDPDLMRLGFQLDTLDTKDALARLRGADRLERSGLGAEDFLTDGDHPVPVRLYVPAGQAIGVVVSIHGGGWVAGSIGRDDPRCRLLAARTGCAVVSVGYRLAPEHPFPQGIEDCATAICWAGRHARAWGTPTDRVAITGTSAGANLAVAAMLQIHATGRCQLPIAQVLLYPICDASMDFPSYRENVTGYFLTRQDMAWYWRQYLAGRDAGHPHASILRSPQLACLPAGLIITSEHDPLRDEGEAFAAKLSGLGLAVKCERYPGATHGFVSLAPESKASQQALDSTSALFRAAFA